MTNKVYVLLKIKEAKCEQAVRVLRRKPGVRILDVLEGAPNLVMMIVAPDRRQLAELTIDAITSVEEITEDQQLLPVRDGWEASVLTKPVRSRRSGEER